MAGPTMERPFEGRVAIVTGASRGIGLAIAERLVAQGANVVITSRNADQLVAAQACIDAQGQVEIMPGHAADAAHQAEVTATAMERFGRIDYLVNNAGINPSYGPLLDTELEVVRKTYDTNVVAALAWVQHVHRAWMGANGGAILNVASIAALLASGTYSAHKAWVRSFTEGLAVELTGSGVTATVLCPGFVHTEFHARGDIDVSAYPEIAWLNAEDVVAKGLADVRRGVVISTPSVRYRTVAAVVRMSPRSAIRRVGRYRKAIEGA